MHKVERHMIESTSETGFDLVVRNGRVLDVARGIDATMDVGIIGSRVAAIGENLAVRAPRSGNRPDVGTQVIDATGALVVPGLVDIHTHLYTGVCPLTVPVDPTMALGGVTTAVSAGDAGAHTIEGFRRLVVERTSTRVFSFLHISRVGLAPWPKGEAVDIDYCDVAQAVRAVEAHRDIVVGIKVRESDQVVGANGLEPLRRALEVGEATDLPVMCHIGDTPTLLSEVLTMLRPGDVLTHCFTGAGNNLLDGGTVIREAFAAKERGIVFDVGHGYGSFDFSVAEAAIGEGFLPDTISTDIHSLSAAGAMKDLPTTMSKMLHLGMTVNQVITAVTSTPATVIGRGNEVGKLEPGGRADVTLLDVLEGEFVLADAEGNQRTASRRFEARSTIVAGIPTFGPYPHPARGVTGWAS
jgi:dihydroorotase